MVRDQSPLHIPIEQTRSHQIHWVNHGSQCVCHNFQEFNDSACISGVARIWFTERKTQATFLFAFISSAIYDLVACFSRFSPLTAVAPEPTTVCVCVCMCWEPSLRAQFAQVKVSCCRLCLLLIFSSSSVLLHKTQRQISWSCFTFSSFLLTACVIRILTLKISSPTSERASGG